jgi:hypothetical protein
MRAKAGGSPVDLRGLGCRRLSPMGGVLLVVALQGAAGAGNPVNTAAQQGTVHHIDLESVGAWESLSRCEWAPLCPSLLLTISLASSDTQERVELQVRIKNSTCGAR